MPNFVKKIIAEQSAILSAMQLDSPTLSVELLIAELLGLSRSEFLKNLIINSNFILDDNQQQNLQSLLLRRQAGEPVAYILGRKEFYGRDFIVTPSTLIPRPETELIVDLALAYFKPAAAKDSFEPEKNSFEPNTRLESQMRFADFGTGSACLAVSLALELNKKSSSESVGKNLASQNWSGLAVDLSLAALKVARQNAIKHSALEYLSFCQADFTQICLNQPQLDLLVANPPYISSVDYAGLSREVKNFEPHSALVSKDNGLFLPFELIKIAPKLLKPKGLFLMEFGCSQGQEIFKVAHSLTAKNTWEKIEIIQDLAGLDRILLAIKA